MKKTRTHSIFRSETTFQRRERIFYKTEIYCLCGTQAAQTIILEAQMAAHKHHQHLPWFLWPFWVLWKFIATILELTGRFVGMVLGIVFIVVGLLVSLTIVGAIVGIPLAIIGLLMLLRGIF